MAAKKREMTIQRILVALDASRDSLAALRAATELACNFEADLHGLFVEDINLLRAAALPMAQELQFPFVSHARMTPERMRLQLRALARQAEAALSSICRKREIEWTFEVVRGDVSSKVVEEAEEADLLCVGKASRPMARGSAIGSTAQAAATHAPRSVLLVSEDARIAPPVVVLYDGSSDAQRALLLAARLARGLAGFLSILVPADTVGSSEEIQGQITADLDGKELMIRYRELNGSGIRSLVAGVEGEGCGTLVVSRTVLPTGHLSELLDKIDCPLILVR